jgi:hypothetical protein
MSAPAMPGQPPEDLSTLAALVFAIVLAVLAIVGAVLLVVGSEAFPAPFCCPVGTSFLAPR